MIPIYYPLLYIVIIKYVPIYFFFLEILLSAQSPRTRMHFDHSPELIPDFVWPSSRARSLNPLFQATTSKKKKKKYKRTIITSTHISLSICHLAVPCPPSVCKWEAEFPWLLSLVIMRAFPESVDVFLDVSLKKKKEGKKNYRFNVFCLVLRPLLFTSLDFLVC